MLRLETIAIGDELLTGRIADTNSAFVAGLLFRAGMRLERTVVVPDEPPAIRAVVGESARRSDFVVCFGGLGPTSDDRTAQVIADLIGATLEQDPPSLARLREFLAKRGRPETSQALKQVVYPIGAKVLPNQVGLAPGFAVRIGASVLYFLPGVPAEMKPMFQDFVLPDILRKQAELGGESLLHRTWKCIGIPESEVQRRMDPIEAALPKNAWLGYRTRFPENHLTLYWRSNGQDPAFEKHSASIAKILSEWTYTDEEKELEEIVFEKLKQSRLTLAFAESCTGGLCAQRLTKIAGSSDVFWGSAVVYQNSAKEKLLDVKLGNPLDAVSKSCTRRLAVNLKERSGSSLSAAVTGYMGPSGGTEEDPNGTFYLCVIGDSIVEKRVFLPGFGREATQWGASSHVLNEIRMMLEKK